MSDITLDEDDEAVLAALREGATTVEGLAGAVGRSADDLGERLADLADNGLVRRTDGEYELTPSGVQLLAASPAGRNDDRIDTPEAVDRRVEALDLPPDEAAALRAAFAFLRYWGEASASEVVDAVYSERPAGYASGEEWWDDLVRDALADLPDVEPPGSDGGDDRWRYAGEPFVESSGDGRLAAGDADASSYGSVKRALESQRLTDDERAAVRRAFEFLRERGEATAAEIRAAVHPERPAGYASGEEWWDDLVRDALADLPDVEPPGSDGGDDRWRYRAPESGPASADPAAEPSESALDGTDPE